MAPSKKRVKVKITVVKRLNTDEILKDVDPGCSGEMDPVCPIFVEGQEFVTDMTTMPDGFCPGAFVDIFRFISGLRSGANYHWINEKGRILVCCTDGFRPVIFRLERIGS
ncbi:MAG: TIGR04076 family protein [Deltaproteobacteria bacterium]|nr:TIGR04076 family protein [Deltaproteobacteria bacterium]